MRSTKEKKKKHDSSAKHGILSKIHYMLNRNKLGELLVFQELITPYELKHALKVQKETETPLGQVLVNLDLISKGKLCNILVKQRVLRTVAIGMLYISSCSGMMRQSNASEPNRIISASAHSTKYADIKAYPALFGADEKQSKNLKAFTKWLEMFERFDEEMQTSSAKRMIHALKIELSDYRNSSIHALAKKVDEVMNAKKYIIDNKNWGKSDYWATPIEFMNNGGDCEDFAIAKYVALRSMGVPDSRMRVAIVQDQKKNIPHAILVVYTEKGPYILDNQSQVMRSAANISHYKPIFSINHSAWWLHTTPDSSANTIVASAK